MSGFYIGVDGKARKIKGGYIGIDGKARKIKKGYIGLNGVARLCWSDVDPVFANNTWEEIALACQTGNVPDSWAIGDQKTMTIDGTDYVIDIIGKNHDAYADGSGKAPLTFQLHDCFVSPLNMNTSDNNASGWEYCAMRTSYVPSVLTKLPSEVNINIREVTKSTRGGNFDNTIYNTSEKLFLLSEIEIFGTLAQSYSGEGVQYEYYVNGGSKIKYLADVKKSWWTRSPKKDNSVAFAIVNTVGSSAYSNANNLLYASFAFCF